MDFAALSAYLGSTLTRHDLIVHSVCGCADDDDNASMQQLHNNHHSTTRTSSSVSMPDEMDLQTSPGNFFSVYNRPFVLNEQWRALDAWVWAQSLPHLPAVLFYNAGLCCHRRAVQRGCRDALYRQALELYQTAELLLEHHHHHTAAAAAVLAAAARWLSISPNSTFCGWR